MKKILLSVFTVVVLATLAFGVQPMKGQISGDFERLIKIIPNAPYQTIYDTNVTPRILPDTQFMRRDFMFPQRGWDPDNGYVVYRFPKNPDGTPKFRFEFNSDIYDSVWICVNGFITFTPPPLLEAWNQKKLFERNYDLPWNVVAPYWGDHYYDTDKDAMISAKYDAVLKVVTIEWKKLNINRYIRDDQGFIIDTNKLSYADFQVKLYLADDPQISYQGKIEFCYGQAYGQDLFVRNSSLGLRGESGDFMNGLMFENNPYITSPELYVDVNTQLTDRWQPSGGSDKRIRFNPNIRFYLTDSWGDGDVDLSHHKTGKHWDQALQQPMPQNRFVTVNDVFQILRSRVTGNPLDPVYRRMAYHGDVNHNGRYYYDSYQNRINIPWKDTNYKQNIQRPPDANAPSAKAIRFEATEYDAAWILHYLSGRIPFLPWYLDTAVIKGRINADLPVANALRFGTITKISENTYLMPVYLNGYYDGAVGAGFDVDAQIVAVDNLQIQDNNIQIFSEKNSVVIAGSGEFDETIPVCNVKFTSTNKAVNLSNIRYNDVTSKPVSYGLTTIENIDNSNDIISNTPNPVSTKTLFTVNAQKDGNYVIAIYDMLGNRVKTIVNGYLQASVQSFDWNACDESGNKVPTGVYVYTMTGENVSISKKIIVE